MKEIEAFTLPITREQFCVEVQTMVVEKEISWIDAVELVAGAHAIDLEDVAPLVDAKIKMELESEFRHRNYLPKIGQLPL